MSKIVKRGEVYFVDQRDTIGSEQGGVRPAVIVSNDIGNKYSPIVEVVFVTTREKKPLPTHVKIALIKDSVALCEQITSIDKVKILDKVCTLDDKEMCEVNKALAISLGI